MKKSSIDQITKLVEEIMKRFLKIEEKYLLGKQLDILFSPYNHEKVAEHVNHLQKNNKLKLHHLAKRKIYCRHQTQNELVMVGWTFMLCLVGEFGEGFGKENGKGR